jgi:phosphatidylserine/phosphatidylglycerophosphate/cardiolipin synthase-like enzyme
VEYWQARGFSVELSGAVLHVCTLVRSGDLQVRIGDGRRPVHAKLYVSERAATLGSSNFTDAGLRTNREANARFVPGTHADTPRYADAKALAEGFWAGGRDFGDGLLALLESLAHATSWEETLARACALLLEGDWARAYLRCDAAELAEKPLWPHQMQGIAQALWVLEPVRRALEQRRARSRPWRLADLDRSLEQEPILAAHLREAFEKLPQLPPIEERVEALIVGVPARGS